MYYIFQSLLCCFLLINTANAALFSPSKPCTTCQSLLPPALIETVSVKQYRFPHIVLPQQPSIAERINEFLRTAVLVPIVETEAQHQTSPALLQDIFNQALLVSNPEQVEYSGIDYQITYNAQDILALTVTVEFMGAYPSIETHYFNFALTSGMALTPADLFQNDSLKTELMRQMKARVTAHAQDIAADVAMPPTEIITQTLADIDLTQWPDFNINRQGVTFYINYQLAHAIRGLAPSEEFLFSYADLKPYLAEEGILKFILRK